MVFKTENHLRKIMLMFSSLKNRNYNEQIKIYIYYLDFKDIKWHKTSEKIIRNREFKRKAFTFSVKQEKYSIIFVIMKN